MTTYNTYQEAKIANPDKEIIRFDKQDEFKAVGNDELSAYLTTWTKCNPADHCMTVEKFLADGCKFVEGDVILSGSNLKEISKNVIDTMNMPSYCDKHTYILRAAALEGRANLESAIESVSRSQFDEIVKMTPVYSKPRTKVKYVKLNVNDEGGKFWEVARDWSEGNADFRFMRGNGDYDLIDSNEELLKLYTNRKLYRRIETTMTEREAFVEALNDLFDSHAMSTSDLFNAILDSGKFKLVN